MNEFDGKTIYIVSDLHIGDGTSSDDFLPFLKLFEQFLDMVEQDPNAILILCGDIFELWQSTIGDIVKVYYGLIKRLFKIETIFIIGNHDIGLFGLIDSPLKYNFLSDLTKEVILEWEDKKVRIIHGHEFDIFNDPARSIFIGHIISLLIGHYEKKDGDFDEWVEKYLEPIFRKTFLFFMNFYRRYFSKERTWIEGKLSRVLKKYHEEHPDHFIIAGHTHQPGWYKNWYINMGSWGEKSKPHYVKITPDRKITLYNFPGNDIVTRQYDD